MGEPVGLWIRSGAAWGSPMTSPGALDTRSDPSTLVLPEGAELADGELDPILCR